MNVRIIPEDDENDHFILKPIFEAMFKHLGKPQSDVRIHRPKVRGWEAVKKWEHIEETISKFSTVHLFVLCVDRDGHEQRRGILDRLETKANQVLEPTRRLFIAEQAWQEVEVWAMAGIDWKLKPKWNWETIRSERDPKEHYFEPIVKARGLLESAGRGRAILGAEAARNYAKVRQNCAEVRDLEDRIRQWIGTASHR
jgi:hypothetical protein